MLGSGFIQFELQYSKTKNLSVGDVVRSGEIFAGGHVWKIYCSPHGTKKSNAGRYVSLYLRLVSKAKCVKAIFEASLLHRGGPGRAKRCTKVYPPNGISSRSRGWHEFVSRTDLESGSGSVRQGCVTFLCGITVLCRQLHCCASLRHREPSWRSAGSIRGDGCFILCERRDVSCSPGNSRRAVTGLQGGALWPHG